MKPLIILPLILAACADCPPLTRAAVQDCQRRAEAGLIRLEDCLCDRPTASLPDAPRERGDRMPEAHRPGAHRPEPPKVEPPKPEPVKDREPNRELDPDGWRDWRDRTPRGGA